MTLPKETTMIERLADAIDNAELGYSLRLTSLVDGVSTYTLTMDGYPDAEFEWIDDGHEEIRKRRREGQARAVLTALREPTPEMKLAGAHAITAEMMKANANYDAACDSWQAMLGAAVNQGEG